MRSKKKKQIYIVLSQSGSIISLILKRITGAQYNHASISLSEDLDCMYSFGRKYTYFPFLGGFVKESTDFGTLKRFKNTKALVMRLDLGEEDYENIRSRIIEMLVDKKHYHYNYLGLLLGGINIVWKQEHCYYCSEFVRDLLQSVDAEGCEVLDPIVHPMQFLDIPKAEVIYTGRLCDYTAS